MVSVLSKFKSSPKSENETQERETEDKAVYESVEEHSNAGTQVESPSIEDVLKEDRGEIDRNLKRAGNDPTTTITTTTATTTPNSSGDEAKGEKEHRNVNPFTKLIKSSVSQLNLSSKNDSTSRGVGKLDTAHNSTGDTSTYTAPSSRTNSRSGTRSTSASPSTPSLSSLSRNLFFKSRPRGSTVSVAQNHEYNERHDAHGHPIPHDNNTTPNNNNTTSNNNNNNNNNNTSHSGSANISSSESLKKSATAPFKSSASSPNVKSLKSMKSISIHNTNPFMHASPPSTTHHNMKKTSTNSSLSKAEGSPAMVYNPYGSINKVSNMLPRATNSSLSTAVNGSGNGNGNGNGNGVNHSISNSSSNGNNNHNNQSGTPSSLGFYLTDGTGEANLLPLPIENPNDHIPDKFKQTSVLFSDDFALVKDATSSIGKGASSDVRTVYNKHLSQSTRKKIYCLKKLCMFNKENPNHFYERCAKEFIIAKSLNGNKHVITTYLLLKIPTTSYMSRGWGFIMEYCDCGDLFNLIVSSKWKKIPTNEKLCIFKQVALGLNYIHSKGIAHKDIKPENILITHEGVAKITDFGVSDFAWNDPEDKNSGIKLSNAFVGSPPYTSPEVMVFQGLSLKEREKLTDKYYDPFKMDLWSLGILFFTMVYQNIPFHSADRSDPQYRDFQMSYSTFQSMNPKFKKDMHPAENPKSSIAGPGSDYKLGKEFSDSNASRVAWKLSDPDPETRYTFNDLIHDPWFVDVKTCTLENPEEDTDETLQHEWAIMNEPLLIPQEEYYKRSTTTTSKIDSLDESAPGGSSADDKTAAHGSTESSDPPATPTNASSVAPSEETKHDPGEILQEAPKEASKVVSSSHSEPEHKRNTIVSRNSTSQLTKLLKSNPMPSPFASTTSANTAVSASDYASSMGSPNGGLLARSTSSVSKGSPLYAAQAVNPVVQKYITKYKEEKRNIKIEYMNKKVSHNHS